MPFPPPMDLLNPGTEPGSLALQADSLLSEPLGKPLERLRLFQKNLFSPPDADHLSVNSSPFATSFPHRWAFLLTLASSVSARYGCPSPPLPHHGSLQTLLLSKSTDFSSNDRPLAEFLPLSSGKNNPEMLSDPKHFPGRAAK